MSDYVPAIKVTDCPPNQGIEVVVAGRMVAIFNVDGELQIINYMGEDIHFEIFIADDSKRCVNPIAHVCIEIDDLETFLTKCAELDVNVSQIPKGHRTLTFIRDYDGNLFEIK